VLARKMNFGKSKKYNSRTDISSHPANKNTPKILLPVDCFLCLSAVNIKITEKEFHE
jgi:hypothetical protein